MLIEDKKEKQKEAEKTKKPERPAAVKVKTEGGKSGGKVILISVICLLAAGIIAVFLLSVTQNLFGGRDAIITYLGAMDPQYTAVQERQENLDKREADITKREEAAAKKEESLAEEKKQIEEQSQTREKSSFEAYIADLSEARLAQLKQVAQIYSSMDPEKAAAVLQQLGSTDDMAVVVYCMKTENAAEIMNCLDKEVATGITESMLS
ncbi:MAG: MotE family protein [Oscillospiraceae bacterium]